MSASSFSRSWLHPSRRHCGTFSRPSAPRPASPASRRALPARVVNRVGVIGAGTMGGGITMALINAGLPVVLLESTQEALERGLATIRKNYQGQIKKGKLTEAALEKRLALISPTLDYAPLQDVDLVIEAVFENLEVKRQVFLKLDAVVRAGAILASNTSALNLDTIASFHPPAPGRHRPALLQPRQRHAPAGDRARRGDGGGRPGDGDGARQAHQEDRGDRRRLRRLHRQPHGGPLRPGGARSAARRCVGGADRPGAREVRHGDGAVPHE